jgi:hypothetical protein
VRYRALAICRFTLWGERNDQDPFHLLSPLGAECTDAGRTAHVSRSAHVGAKHLFVTAIVARRDVSLAPK